jgi:hypothetical protein
VHRDTTFQAAKIDLEGEPHRVLSAPFEVTDINLTRRLRAAAERAAEAAEAAAAETEATKAEAEMAGTGTRTGQGTRAGEAGDAESRKASEKTRIGDGGDRSSARGGGGGAAEWEQDITLTVPATAEVRALAYQT